MLAALASTKVYPRLSTITLALVYLLIILGAATRVYDAGMSCPDWPHCYGTWIPFIPGSVPGGYVVGTTSYHWWQVSLEWTHRLTAAIVSALLLTLLIGSLRRPVHERLPIITALIILAIQIGLGGLTVLKSNINWSVSIHLGAAMLVFAALAWHRRAIAAGIPPKKGYKVEITPTPVKAVVIALPPLVLLLMMVGAYVSSSHAGGVCGGLFNCGGDWFPTDLAQHSHMMHRYLALTLLILSGLFISLAKRQAPHFRHAAGALHGMVWAQAGLGIATLYSFTEYPGGYELLSLAHLAWGTLVWLVAMGTLLNLKYGKAGRFHG